MFYYVLCIWSIYVYFWCLKIFLKSQSFHVHSFSLHSQFYLLSFKIKPGYTVKVLCCKISYNITVWRWIHIIIYVNQISHFPSLLFSCCSHVFIFYSKENIKLAFQKEWNLRWSFEITCTLEKILLKLETLYTYKS